MTVRRKMELDKAVAKIGASARCIQGDTSRLAGLDRIFAKVRDKAGTINVLFANAGGGEFLAVGSITEKHLDRIFATNVRGTLFTVQRR